MSIEPGNQIEFSTPPVATLNELAAEFERHTAELKAVLDPAKRVVAAAGIAPFSRAEELPAPVRRRHRFMAGVLPPRSETAEHMMKATASTQAAFRLRGRGGRGAEVRGGPHPRPGGETRSGGNSPRYGGAGTGWASYRGRVWVGMDADRCGLLPHLLADGLSFGRWADYLLDRPMLFVVEGREYRPTGGRTFRQFPATRHRRPLPHARGLGGPHHDRLPGGAAESTSWRCGGADANPPPLALAVPALWKGLLYSDTALTAAAEVAKRIPPADLPGLFEATARRGLAGEYGGRTLLAWAKEGGGHRGGRIAGGRAAVPRPGV